MAETTTTKSSKSTKSSNIQRTTDYGQFKFLQANRVQNRGHIETLKKAFEEVGNLTRVQPILVNDNFEIIDGQHRFIACRELELPIYYTTVEGLGVHEARSMNILHRNWNMDDFAASYAESGDINYKAYIRLREDYGFNNSITLTAVYGTERKGAFAEFRNGEFVIGNQPAVRARLDYLAEVVELLPFALDRYAAIAIFRAMNSSGFDPEHLLKKLALHPEMMQKRAGVLEYLRDLELVYNFKLHEDNKVRLF